MRCARLGRPALRAVQLGRSSQHRCCRQARVGSTGPFSAQRQSGRELLPKASEDGRGQDKHLIGLAALPLDLVSLGDEGGQTLNPPWQRPLELSQDRELGGPVTQGPLTLRPGLWS